MSSGRGDQPGAPDIDPRLVEAVAAKLMASVRPSASPTMGKLWEGYWLAVGRSKKSARDISGTWRRLCVWRAPDGRSVAQMRASDLDATFPAAYRDWRMGRETRRGRAPAIGTVNRELERLRAVLNWAVDNGLLPHHPLCRMRLAPEDSVKQTKIRSEKDFDALLVACADRHHILPALVLLYFDGGLRRLEGIHARWEDVEIKAGGGGRLRLVGRRTKSGKPRYAHLTRRAVARLEALPRTSEWVFANDYVYPTGRRSRSYGKPYNPTYLYRLFEAAVAASGLTPEPGEKITFHTLRHSFAYRARRRWKWPEQVIMRQGGWSTRSAFDRYGISDDEELDEAMNAAETAIGEDTRKPPHPSGAGNTHVPKSLRLVK